ncbi:glucosaminidase domain-containing protein [Prevotella sp. E9-3]|uniref:glucosaminidase domain-containing protein n=1 Tax=Prevotella sp. E9-3 TaxID=2913621 RepID=UPI001EDA7E3F|nr:glucosaminidase domain-containing protein [Prevotella sp. E9-3]UKK49579.1 glucosaminidase domain-containing protein [Prevotella sp. E9-3]
MRKVFLSVALTLSLLVHGQARWNQQYQSYIDQYKDVAIEQMHRWNIPASITLAQGLFESGAGRSELATKGNNHFGIKCHGWTGRTVYHDDDRKGECFRAYKSAYESYDDHSRFLASSQRYASLFKLNKRDYKGWARGLKAAGYATNPQYANKLIEIIQLYKLYEYDTAKKYDKTLAKHTKDNSVYGAALHPIKQFNKNYYVIARRGDTFKSIAKELGVSYRRLARFNERDKDDILEQNDIVWLKKKRSNAPKEYKNRMHYVKEGESMYSISQYYGIRLKSLYKMNHLKPDYQIQVGAALRVR